MRKWLIFRLTHILRSGKMRFFLATLLLHTTSAQLFETRLLLIKVPSMHTSSTNSAIALAIHFL